VTDGITGPLEDDALVAESLRRAAKPALVVVNKIDGPTEEPAAADFFRLGLGEPHALSALHGRGSGDFLDALVAVLPEREERADPAWGSVAIIGRPNVGKSSLLNALLRQERAIVDEIPGTTRDPVDSMVEVGDRIVRLVDTAGMRREVQIKDEIEYFGWLRSRRTLTRVDAVVVVVDISEGVTGSDQRIASDVLESGRACVVVLNKWDLVTGDEVDRARLERDTAERLRFVPWAKIVRTSARTGRGVERLLPVALEAISSHRRRLQTADVNRIVRRAQEARPHPRRGGRSIRVLYAVQTDVSPPTVALFSSGRLEPSYIRYLEHSLRAVEPFAGSPLRFETRVKTRREVKT
jgi:GTPase